jgi:hypothetical protein
VNQEKSGKEATADGTPPKEAPASETQNPPTTQPDASPAPAAVVSGEEDYETMLEKALSEAPAADPAPAPGDGETPPADDTAPPEDASQPPPDDTPPADDDTPPAAKTEFRPRLSKLDERQKEAILLAKERAEAGEKISLAEAEKRVAAKYGDKPADDTAPPKDDEAPRTPEQIAQEIADAKEERRKAVRDIDAEGQLSAEDKIEALEAELAAARDRTAAADQSAEEEFAAKVDAAHARAKEVYPVMSQEAHPIHDEAKAIWQTMLDTDNPLVHDPQAPLKIYQMAANNLGIAPNSSPSATTAATNGSSPKKPRPQAVQQQAVVQQRAVSPASGGARTQTQPGQTNADPASRIKTAADYEAFLEQEGV